MSSEEDRPKLLIEARARGYARSRRLGDRLGEFALRQLEKERRHERRLYCRTAISVACGFYITGSFHGNVPISVMVTFLCLASLLLVATLRSMLDELINAHRSEHGRLGVALAKKEAETEARVVRAKAEGYAMGLMRGRQGFYIQECEPGLDETG